MFTVQAVDGALQKFAVEQVPLVHTPEQHTPPPLLLQLLPSLRQILPGPPSLFDPASLLWSWFVALPVDWLQLQPASQPPARTTKNNRPGLFITKLPPSDPTLKKPCTPCALPGRF